MGILPHGPRDEPSMFFSTFCKSQSSPSLHVEMIALPAWQSASTQCMRCLPMPPHLLIPGAIETQSESLPLAEPAS